MKPRVWVIAGSLLFGCCALFAVAVLEQNTAPVSDPASLLPQGALIAIEASDFGALLHDWNSSQEKRAWIQGANYESFSRSRLFERLSQAQDEFSTAATVAPDSAFLAAVAGKQSYLGIYDIGKLEFVYISRLDPGRIESSPLWVVRDKFERRSEAGSDFYVRKDSNSSRTAVFASRDGWLILGTREDLVADVLDRMGGSDKANLASEAWYAEAVKQAATPGELRMVLNLTKVVPSPYFRSYWIQRNVTEMKQYSSAVSDLRREGAVYREERVLLRRNANSVVPAADVRSIAALAPDGVALSLAQATPDSEPILQALRDDLLERRAQGATIAQIAAPQASSSENAGDASQLDTEIDQAPTVVVQADPFQSLRSLFTASQPAAMMECYTTHPANNDVFVSLATAAVLEGQNPWDAQAVQRALTAALSPRLTTGALGAQWSKRTGVQGDYFALDGAVGLFLKIDGKWLILASDSRLLDDILARLHKLGTAMGTDALTYSAAYYPAREQSRYQQLMRQLDHAGHGGENGGGDSPTFLAGNIGSLSQAFSNLDSEQIDERDNGSLVRQTVTYRWKR
jgi:hypothetical protein